MPLAKRRAAANVSYCFSVNTLLPTTRVRRPAACIRTNTAKIRLKCKGWDSAPSLLRLAHSSSSHSLRANNKHQTIAVSKSAFVRGPVAHDAAHDGVRPLHVKRDGAGGLAAQDCARVRGERGRSIGFGGVFCGGRGGPMPMRLVSLEKGKAARMWKGRSVPQTRT